MFQIYQGRNATGAARKHVPHQRARRPLEGKRLHHQEAEGVSPDGGELEQGERNRQSGAVRNESRMRLASFQFINSRSDLSAPLVVCRYTGVIPLH